MPAHHEAKLITMKSTPVVTLFAVVVLLYSVSVPADGRAQSDQGPQSNSAKLNGLTFNGRAFNGPGLVVQGRTFNGRELNGPGLVLQARNFNGLERNGPGIVLQGNRFNGFRMNGSDLFGFDAWGQHRRRVFAESCMAPQPAREWPLSALRVSDVHVRLVTR